VVPRLAYIALGRAHRDDGLARWHGERLARGTSQQQSEQA